MDLHMPQSMMTWGTVRFTSDDEVRELVQTWIREQPNRFLSQEVKKFVERYNKWIDLQKD